MDELKIYLEKAFESFDNDPAQTPYQEGYLDALTEVYKVFCAEEIEV